MWKIRHVKKAARHHLRKNYFQAVLVCLIIAFVISGPFSISETVKSDLTILEDVAKNSKHSRISKAADDLVNAATDFQKATSIGDDSDAGVISNIYTKVQKSGGIVRGVFHAASVNFSNKHLVNKVAGVLGVGLAGFLYIFFGAVLQIGRARFFLESRLYTRTSGTQILFIYRIKRGLRAAAVIVLKTIFMFLWMFTIVGFPIKYYSYYLVEYLFAENADIPPKDILKLSARLMKGSKFKVFLLDLTFIYWHLLSVTTFGIVKYAFLTPYISASKAELYAELRQRAIDGKIEGYELLNDDALFEKHEYICADDEFEEKYPNFLHHIPIVQHRRWVNVEPKESYTPLNLILMFFLFAFVGWVWECALAYIQHGFFVNRGMLYGPWIPIYGAGGAAILLLTNRFNKKPLKTFFLTVLACAILEYGTATITWYTMHEKYWDYSGYFFNIQGRICLEGLMVFGLGGMMAIYFLAPIMDNLLNKIPLHARQGIATGLSVLFVTDVTIAHFYPRTGKGLTYDN
ncbi:MAG: DUF975 family protein [Clostridiales Family XIII bacterium]|jgi:uncharacterized membrane protein|nr:DUF975 family protein [Clostridiales Family XIII bacterium]